MIWMTVNVWIRIPVIIHAYFHYRQSNLQHLQQYLDFYKALQSCNSKNENDQVQEDIEDLKKQITLLKKELRI